jgi:hypothetical protein
MADLREQCASIKLPFNWGKMLYKLLLKAACGEQTVVRTQFFEWFSKFECDLISVENPEYLRHLSTSRMHESTA